MKTCKTTKLIHSGDFVGEVDVTLLKDDEGWSPYLSVEDSEKLDDVKDALDQGDLRRASSLARVFKLTPVDA